MQAVSLPLAAIYLKTHGGIPAAALISGAAFLLVWIIGQSLLSMYRFPLESGPALGLTAGMAAQALIVGLWGGSLTLAAYAAFYSSLFAIVVCGLLLFLHLVSPWKRRPAWWTIPVAGLAAAGWLLFCLGRPLAAGLDQLDSPGRIAALTALGLHTLGAIRSLYGFSVFSSPHPREDAFSREWKKWAAPTVIVLILSVTAAAILAGIK